MILGLDVSTSCTGWAVFAEDGLVDFGAIKTATTTKSTFFSKMENVVEKLKEIKEKHKIEHVYIEEILNKFAAGKSTAKTIVSLARFNGTVSYKVYEIFGLIPNYMPAMTARKACKIKVPRDVDTKEFILQHIVNAYPQFELQYSNQGNVAKHLFDIADAIVIAEAGYGEAKTSGKLSRTLH